MKYLITYLLLIIVAGTALSLIIENINFSGMSNSILVVPVPEKKNRPVSKFDTTILKEDTVRENIYIKKENAYFIRFEKPVLLLTLFKPDNKILLSDNLYCLLILSLSVLLMIRLWRLDHYRLFSDTALNTIKFSAILIALFWLIDYGRYFLMADYIEKITEKKYTIEKMFLFNSPLYFVAIFLLFIRNILKSGSDIQKEQDLTI